MMFVTLCNAPLFGGGMRIAPQASMDDGQLEIVAIDQVPKLELLRLFPRVFSGRHVEHPAVSIVRTRRVRVTAEPQVLLGSDGEIEGEVGASGVDVSVVSSAIRVVRPA